ncbi:MAG TPA: hypothetical protein VED67_03320 [Thermodesulfovibrionales bacterium]|jgi:rubrerythrin|nr:hypothetical protein [Thermodesulfovibrionales bacterium]
MEKISRTDDLFAGAIAAENAAKDFYKSLSLIFSHVPEASLIWERMMKDEDFHSRELQAIRNTLSDEQLSKPLDQSIADKVSAEMNNLPAKVALNKVKTLNDALDLAYELEYSEVNAVFQVIIREFVSSESRAKFVLSLVREHVSRLEEFSRMIPSTEERRKLLAVHIRNTDARKHISP